MQATTFKEAIDNRRFLEAEDMINRGDDLLKSQFQFKLSDSFSAIITNNAFHVLDALIEHNHIELDIFEYDNFQNTIFSELMASGQDTDECIAFLERLIPQVDNLNDNLEDDTWLTIAFRNGAAVRIIQTMIENGCDINYINNREETFLHLIVSLFHHKINDEKRLQYVQLLIDNGIDVNKQKLSGDTALHLANKFEIIQLLLENGSDPNLANKQGKTAYHKVILEQFNFEVAEQMAEIFPPDFDVETGSKSDLFFDYISGYNQRKEDLEFFQKYGANPDKVNQDVYDRPKTVWDVVVEKNFEFFEAFVDLFQPDVNQQDDLGNTLLHKVCAYNVNFEQHKAKDIYRKTKKLIAMGVDVSISNTADEKPIDLAGKDNLKEKTVALLLKQTKS